MRKHKKFKSLKCCSPLFGLSARAAFCFRVAFELISFASLQRSLRFIAVATLFKSLAALKLLAADVVRIVAFNSPIYGAVA